MSTKRYLNVQAADMMTADVDARQAPGDGPAALDARQARVDDPAALAEDPVVRVASPAVRGDCRPVHVASRTARAVGHLAAHAGNQTVPNGAQSALNEDLPAQEDARRVTVHAESRQALVDATGIFNALV